MLPGLFAKWEKIIGVKVNQYGVRKMKTRWGTCNRDLKRIWINYELVKKPIDCLEYVVVHEMAHFLERLHNDRFVSLMNQYLPKWRSYRDELNRFPISHTEWKY